MEKTARVAIRSNAGGANFIFPTRVYIYLSDLNDDAEPARLGMRYDECTWRDENLRATRRMRNIVTEAEKLAQAYNEGRMNWDEVANKF